MGHRRFPQAKTFNSKRSVYFELLTSRDAVVVRSKRTSATFGPPSSRFVTISCLYSRARARFATVQDALLSCSRYSYHSPNISICLLADARSQHVARSTLIRSTFAKRTVQTESTTASASAEILSKQRFLRPSSPQFTIYQPQIASIADHATGGALSAMLYAFALAYLVAPGIFDSVPVVEFVTVLPEGVKYVGKAVLAEPFAFHGLNGIRHLSWD
ncbi:hypothetical protein C8J57DRAFT_1068684 [Mycena rebaudengoi]|nr:hypothetical protein C8J57DRAFT_1068684 [Mycena rebaudengoi]